MCVHSHQAVKMEYCSLIIKAHLCKLSLYYKGGADPDSGGDELVFSESEASLYRLTRYSELRLKMAH